ncbi:MAG: methyl-accepting chemotaxis protein [Bacteroidales bacterium]|nr:methyl-accepting chemotaxis protein [Bacteroidales bacterium]
MKKNSLRVKLPLFVGGGLFITILILIVYSSIQLRTETIESAKLQLQEEAATYAYSIQQKIEGALNETRVLSNAFASIKSNTLAASISRDDVNAMLKQHVEVSPTIIGIGSIWEPNAFDGLDAEYANSPNHDASGRFIPYWTKSGVTATVGYDDAESGTFYSIPKSTKKETIISPYIYPTDGKDILVITAVVPIMYQGEFYGINGIDISVEFIQNQLENNTVFGGNAEIMITAYDGTIAGYSKDNELAGKNIITDYHYEESYLHNIQSAYKEVEIKEDTLHASIPIQFGNTGEPWQVSVQVPMEVVLKKANQKVLIQISSGIALMLIVLFVLVIYLRRVTAPLGELSDLTRLIAEGDLTRSVDIRSNDEVGELAVNNSMMVEKLKTIIENISDTSSQFVSSSKELNSLSQSVSQGANEQAASVEEVSSSMEEMSANIRQNMDNASESKVIATNATNSMKRMSEAGKASLESIQNISEKITIINEIAMQTNILALNAAVEAVRAGDSGRGFAVVAGEVRKLAERSKTAAEEIEELSNSSVLITEETSQMLEKILPEIDKSSNLTQEIALSSIEQNTGSEQINNAVQELNKVTQQNASASEQMAASAEELEQQANALKELISHFRI